MKKTKLSLIILVLVALTALLGGCGKTFTVTFHANEGEGTMDSQRIDTAATAKLTKNSFTREGYRFAGWAEATTVRVAYFDEADFPMFTRNVDLYAKWSVLDVSAVEILVNGGSFI